MKKYINSDNKYLILTFFMFVLLCCLFPYSGDDWAWGTQIGIDRLANWFDNYNGRYAGNLLVLLLTRSKVLRVVVESVAFLLMVKYIYKVTDTKNKTYILITILLLLLMPVSILRQTVTWASGFANYVLPILLILFIIFKNIQLLNNKQDFNEKNIFKLIIYFIVSFIGSLFIENITLYNLFLIIVILLYEKIKFKKFSIANIFYFLGSLLGSIMMFSNSAYLSIFNSDDTYRTIAKDNIIISSIKTFIKTLTNYIFTNNIIVGILLSLCIIILILKYKNKVENKKLISKKELLLNLSLLFTVLYLFNIIYVNMPSNSYLFTGKVKYVFNCGISLMMVFSLVTVTIICINNKFKSRKILFYIFSIIIFNLPLLIITPIGPRLFLTTYIFYILIIIEILDYIYKNKINCVVDLLKIVVIIAFSYLLIIYYSIYKVDTIQTKYIEQEKSSLVIYLPKLPYHNYVHCTNISTGVFGERYKLFHNIDQETVIEFLKYEDWKKAIKK